MSEPEDQKPLVSITFPIHRMHDYAQLALESILNQTYTNLEVMFLDNSKMGIKEEFDFSDKRIKYFKLPEIYGVAETLNFAINNAQGKYLARMDYDDIALPERISKQVSFMEKNREITISGGYIQIIGDSIDKNVKPGEIVRRPLNHEELIEHLLSKNPFFHPTVIIRLDRFRKEKLRYRSDYDSAEDLDLWMRASHKVKLANIDEVLLQYRTHPSQFSRLDALNSSRNAIKIAIFHTIWMVRKRKINTLKGCKMIIKSWVKFIKLQSSYVASRKFNKFESYLDISQ